jgi:hypothetical protein
MDALRQWNAYVNLAKKHTTHDEMFFFDELRASLIMDILNMSPELLIAARLRWSSDPAFSQGLSRWLPQGEGRVVFVGIYARHFKAEEFLTSGSYRVRLKAGGMVYDPDHFEEVKEPILGNYFPVFNQWEKVFAVHFPGTYQRGASLIVEFPSGTRELFLKDDVS